MTYLRKNIETMAGYVPGEQPPPGSKVIKLNTNENPYPPSPAAIEILRSFDAELLRRYPDPVSSRVRTAVSRVFSVPEDWVLVGNGSDEILSMLVRACCEAGRPLAYAMPTYVLYRTLAELQDAPFAEASYDEEYNLPVEELIRTDGALTIVCTPNSPSGTTVPLDQLESLASNLTGILAVDEAYVDFADGDALSLVQRYRNVIVLRTLSKGYSLAGLRLGFGIGSPDLIDGLMKIKDSYNVNALSCLVGAAAIEDQAHKNANVSRVRASREKLSEALINMGFRVWPSQSNFLLTRPPKGDAELLYRSLKQEGILVRYFNQPHLDDKLRISVGTDEENAILVRALARLIS